MEPDLKILEGLLESILTGSVTEIPLITLSDTLNFLENHKTG
jgi:hypothetical protein